MLAFKILVNGNEVCTAGADDGHRVLATSLSWTFRNPGELQFNVGGVAESDQHLGFNVPEISIGDQITIEVVDTHTVSTPDTVIPPTDRRSD